MKLTLHRRYAFSASHRLHSPQLSEAENQHAYGKCNNPYGHGHNYIVEVAVSGPVDPETGMIANLADLDSYVQREVLDAFDHTYLNEQVPAFQQVVPTTENVAREIFHRIENFPSARLERIKIQETSLNSFEYDRQTPGGSSS
jgi:6-pyruvoyltetrahydropterin/6-carboxytetrahydropterin synthase